VNQSLQLPKTLLEFITLKTDKPLQEWLVWQTVLYSICRDCDSALMVENGGNVQAIIEQAERRSVNLTTVAECEQKQAKSHNHK